MRKLTVLSSSSVLFPSMTKMMSSRGTPRYGTMHSVAVATTARGAHFLSTEQSCRTPSKRAVRSGWTWPKVPRLDGSHHLLDLDPPDVLDQGLECIDRAQADLLPEEALRRARLLKAVQRHPVQLVRLFEGRLRPGLRPRRVRRPDAQRFMSVSTLPSRCRHRHRASRGRRGTALGHHPCGVRGCVV